MRLLDQAKIEYESYSFPYDDEEHLSGVAVSQLIGKKPDQVYKTLVATDGSDYFVAVIPADKELDLKALAREVSAKKVEMLHLKDLTKITGYIRGGCSPLGMKRDFPTYIDSDASNHNEIIISAGLRGVQIGLNPNDLAKVIGATIAPITH